MIELTEFLKMLATLNIFVEQRIVMMLFKLFDRADQGYFKFDDFYDILEERMIPNYQKIVALERNKWTKKHIE